MSGVRLIIAVRARTFLPVTLEMPGRFDSVVAFRPMDCDRRDDASARSVLAFSEQAYVTGRQSPLRSCRAPSSRMRERGSRYQLRHNGTNTL